MTPEQIIALLPKEGLTAIGTIVVTIISLLWASKSKIIPFSINFGHMKRVPQDYVTEDHLRANCEKRQGRLDGTLNEIKSGNTVILSKLEELKESTQQKLSEHTTDIAVIKERLRLRRESDREAA